MLSTNLRKRFMLFSIYTFLVFSGLSYAQSPLPADKYNSAELLYIFVDFNDEKAIGNTNPADDYPISEFTHLMPDAISFFHESSYGKANLKAATETHGTANDGLVGWLRLNQNHPDPKASNANLNHQLARDALIAADPFVDYASYDINGDGFVDSAELGVIVIAAGFEWAKVANFDEVNSVPGNVGAIGGPVAVPILDGVSIGGWHNGAGRYGMMGALHTDGDPSTAEIYTATAGILFHEIAHLLFKLPDLCPCDPINNGMGPYGLMAGGVFEAIDSNNSGSNPADLSAWSKVEIGWVTPMVNPYIADLHALSSPDATPENAVAKFTTSNPDEYFLAEVRVGEGLDAGIFNDSWPGGLAIYHINEAGNKADKVDIEEADGQVLLNGGINGVWRSDVNAIFNNASTPNSLLTDGSATSVDLEVLSTPGNVMRLKSRTSNPFYVIHKPTGLKLHSCTGTDGSPVVSIDGNDTSNCSKWRPIETTNGFFILQSEVFSKNIRPNTSTSGSAIVTRPNSWTGNWVQWEYVSTNDGYGYFKHRVSGKHIYLPGTGAGAGAELQPSNWTGNYTRWQFEEAK